MADAHMLLLCCQVSGGSRGGERGCRRSGEERGIGVVDGDWGCPLGRGQGGHLSWLCHNPLPIVLIIETSIAGVSWGCGDVTRGKISAQLSSISGNAMSSHLFSRSGGKK